MTEHDERIAILERGLSRANTKIRSLEERMVRTRRKVMIKYYGKNKLLKFIFGDGFEIVLGDD